MADEKQANMRNNDEHRARLDGVLVIVLALAAFAASSASEFNETLSRWTHAYERIQLDELPLTLLVTALALAWFSWRRWREARTELAQRRKAEAELSASRQQLQQLAQRCISIQEDEQRKLARELHDELGQYLNAIKIDAVTLRNLSAEAQRANISVHAGKIHSGALSIIQLTNHVYGEVRSIMNRLRPVALDELGLVAAIEYCVAGWRERLPQTRFFFIDYDSGAPALDEATNMTLYRAVQECLTNIARHAQAGEVIIELHSTATHVRLAVRDNGIGFDATPADGSASADGSRLGLLGMRERVTAAGGSVQIQSTPGEGTMVQVVFLL